MFILVYSKTAEEHAEHLEKVFQKLQSNKLYNRHLTKTRLFKSLEIIHTYVASCTFSKISVQIGIF